MKAVTIGQLHLKDHIRWAEDQQSLDISLVTDSPIVAPHPEIIGSSALYPSQCDLLFELQKRNLHWASFEAPKHFHLFSKRFFSHRLFSHFCWEKESEQDGDSTQQERDEPNGSSHPSLLQRKRTDEGLKKIMHAIARAQKFQYQTTSVS